MSKNNTVFIGENRKFWDFVDEELTQRFAGLSRVKFYLPDDADGAARLEQIRAALKEAGYDTAANVGHSKFKIDIGVIDPDAPEDKRREHLSDMHRQLSRIDWLVSALLKLARLDANAVAMNMRSVELAQLVADSLAPIAIQMELKDQTAVVAASGSVFCDPSWTAEALTNILKNCSEHMGEGRLHITASENPIYSQITIRDEGPGIDGKDLPHLFERFYKGGNSDKNSVGIGLALCRMIVVKQNGTVKAENAPQGGALFTVRIYKETV